MIGKRKAPVRRLGLPKDDMASPLAINFVPEHPKGGDGFAPRDARKNAHTAMSMTSSLIAGGIGSPRSRKLSR